MSALAGYLAVAQLAQHLDLALPDDIAAGEPVTLGIRSVRPDGRSHHDPSFRWPWPGNWTPRICLLYTSPSPRDRTRSRMPSSA